MTWVVKPQEIAYQSQTERFEHLLTKLNLSDGQGKIRDDVDFLSRLENMPENERQDWNELDDVSDYLVHRLDLGLMTALIMRINEKPLYKDMVKKRMN